MKLVKFNKGTFGVRKWDLIMGYVYLDMRKGNFWWDDIHKDEFAANKSELIARGWMEKIKNDPLDLGTPV